MTVDETLLHFAAAGISRYHLVRRSVVDDLPRCTGEADSKESQWQALRRHASRKASPARPGLQMPQTLYYPHEQKSGERRCIVSVKDHFKERAPEHRGQGYRDRPCPPGAPQGGEGKRKHCKPEGTTQQVHQLGQPIVRAGEKKFPRMGLVPGLTGPALVQEFQIEVSVVPGRAQWQERELQHRFILREVFYIRQAQRTAGYLEVVPGQKDCRCDHAGADAQPNPQPSPLHQKRQQSDGQQHTFVGARHHKDCKAQTHCPRGIRVSPSHDARKAPRHQCAPDGGHCATPVRIHPITGKAQRNRQRACVERPAPRQPPEACPPHRPHHPARAKGDAEPRMSEQHLPHGHHQ